MLAGEDLLHRFEIEPGAVGAGRGAVAGFEQQKSRRIAGGATASPRGVTPGMVNRGLGLSPREGDLFVAVSFGDIDPPALLFHRAGHFPKGVDDLHRRVNVLKANLQHFGAGLIAPQKPMESPGGFFLDRAALGR